MEWGRNASPAASIAGKQPRYGMRSIFVACCALVAVSAAFAVLINMPKDAPEPWSTIAGLSALGAYGLAAPLLHVAGMVFGIRGLLGHGGGKVSALLGLLLNIGLVALGLLVGWAAINNVGAFT